jgi:hypothetical protein
VGGQDGEERHSGTTSLVRKHGISMLQNVVDDASMPHREGWVLGRCNGVVLPRTESICWRVWHGVFCFGSVGSAFSSGGCWGLLGLGWIGSSSQIVWEKVYSPACRSCLLWLRGGGGTADSARLCVFGSYCQTNRLVIRTDLLWRFSPSNNRADAPLLLWSGVRPWCLQLCHSTPGWSRSQLRRLVWRCTVSHTHAVNL